MEERRAGAESEVARAPEEGPPIPKEENNPVIARQPGRRERTHERAENVRGGVQRLEVRPTGRRGGEGGGRPYAVSCADEYIVGAGAGGASDFPKVSQPSRWAVLVARWEARGGEAGGSNMKKSVSQGVFGFKARQGR